MVLHTLSHLVPLVTDPGGGVISDPSPKAPPGTAATVISNVIGYIKWIAFAALIGCFFAGLIAFAGGRLWDHHRAGKLGTTMMLSSLGGALLFSVGYTLISTFAGAK
jgi:hypothetical protein